jgi:hypothetical protein
MIQKELEQKITINVLEEVEEQREIAVDGEKINL